LLVVAFCWLVVPAGRETIARIVDLGLGPSLCNEAVN